MTNYQPPHAADANASAPTNSFQPTNDTMLLRQQAHLLELASDAIIAQDMNGIITFWNLSAEALYGWSRAEALGKRASDLLLTRYLTPESVIHASLKTRGSWEGELLRSRRDGTRLAVFCRRALERDEHGQPVAILEVDHDITARRQIENERERLHDIALAANSLRDLDEIMLMIRNAVVEVEGFERAGVHLKENGVIHGVWGTDEMGFLRDEHDVVMDPAQLSPDPLRVIRAEIPYCVVTATPTCFSPRVPDLQQSVRDFAFIGLHAGDETIGLITADNLFSGRPITNEQLRGLLPFCEQVAVAIANARLLSERQRMIERQQRLMEIATAINASQELDVILRLVRDAIVEAGGFDRAGVFRVEGDMVRGSWGTDLQGQPISEHDFLEPLSEWAEFTDQLQPGRPPFVIAEGNVDIDPSHGMTPCAVVALRHGDEVVGMLCMDNYLSARPVLPEDVLALLAFCEQAAVAIANARLRAEREMHMERQRSLTTLAAAACATVTLHETLRLVRDAIVVAGGFDRAGVFLFDMEQGVIRGTWGTDRAGQREDISNQVYPLDSEDPTPLQIIARGESDYILSPNYTARYSCFTDSKMHGVQAHAVVALKANGRVLGAIAADNAVRNAPITNEDVQGLLPFADLAAVAIQNARLFEEVRRAQEALVRSEKLRAVGELASGVAHNVNNVLTAVLGYAELIQDMSRDTPEIRHYATIIERAATDGAQIVKRMQHFARATESEDSAVFNLSAAAQEALDLTRPAWRNEASGRGARIIPIVDLAPSLMTSGVASEVREVIVNLIKNAAEAMPEGGTLTVRSFADEGYAVLEISDTGIGMDEAVSRRVFEPFFTTKGVSLGLGLGLSVAWGIIQQHQGQIDVESAAGQGATFRVRLPLARADAPSLPIAALNAPLGADESLKGIRLLLVDDEELVLSGLARMLAARGADVSLASDGIEALTWLETHAGNCDLILTDHGMVGLTGLELLGLVRERFPRIRRILISGWGATPPGTPATSAAERILNKPIRQDELVAALTQLLASQPADSLHA